MLLAKKKTLQAAPRGVLIAIARKLGADVPPTITKAALLRMFETNEQLKLVDLPEPDSPDTVTAEGGSYIESLYRVTGKIVNAQCLQPEMQPRYFLGFSTASTGLVAIGHKNDARIHGLLAIEFAAAGEPTPLWAQRTGLQNRYASDGLSLAMEKSWTCNSVKAPTLLSYNPIPRGEEIVTLGEYVVWGGTPLSGGVDWMWQTVKDWLSWKRMEERFLTESKLEAALTRAAKSGVVPSNVSASSMGVLVNSSKRTAQAIFLPTPDIPATINPADSASWVQATLRHLWAEIVNGIKSTEIGITDYKPFRLTFLHRLGIFGIGAVAGWALVSHYQNQTSPVKDTGVRPASLISPETATFAEEYSKHILEDPEPEDSFLEYINAQKLTEAKADFLKNKDSLEAKLKLQSAQEFITHKLVIDNQYINTEAAKMKRVASSLSDSLAALEKEVPPGSPQFADTIADINDMMGNLSKAYASYSSQKDLLAAAVARATSPIYKARLQLDLAETGYQAGMLKQMTQMAASALKQVKTAVPLQASDPVLKAFTTAETNAIEQLPTKVKDILSSLPFTKLSFTYLPDTPAEEVAREATTREEAENLVLRALGRDMDVRDIIHKIGNTEPHAKAFVAEMAAIAADAHAAAAVAREAVERTEDAKTLAAGYKIKARLVHSAAEKLAEEANKTPREPYVDDERTEREYAYAFTRANLLAEGRKDLTDKIYVLINAGLDKKTQEQQLYILKHYNEFREAAHVPATLLRKFQELRSRPSEVRVGLVNTF